MVGVVMTGCADRDRPVKPSPVKPDSIPRVSVQEGNGQFFSFFDLRAEMQTVEHVHEVTDTARTDVMVTDPGVRLPGDLVIVADLRKKSASGEYRSWVEPKGMWLDRVVPKTSQLTGALASAASEAPTPAEVKPKAKLKRRHRRRRPRKVVSAPVVSAEPAAASPAPTASASSKAQVILFTTAWCPSCKSARRFFESKRVAFKELDVERDQQAQQQYLSIQRAYKLRPGVVPLIIVNGRIFQGFSQPQVEAALAAGPPKG